MIAHTDHPMRHWDRTCPACINEAEKETMNTDNKVLVWDIDGTLANCEHRQHHVQNKPKRWDLFNAGMANDSPHGDIIWLFQTLQKQEDTIMLIASGRGEEHRSITEEWLTEHEIFFRKLYMRPAKDSRRDSIIKTEILDQIRMEFATPFIVFDDRRQVVDMWRENGVRCLQVQPGEF